jgi:DNA polymerase-1
MLALIDHDLVVFRSAASAENDSFNIAKYRAEQLLDSLMEKTKATEYRAFISSKNNFRKDILPSYKANRTAPKPVHLKALQDYALEHMNAELAREGLEADDELAINQTDDTIIVSLDKDLLQVAGQHFSWEISGKNWKRPDIFRKVTEIDGLRLFFEQCIKGDTSDNVKGIKGFGDKKAKDLLKHIELPEEMFMLVQDMYDDDEAFIQNASCLWMKRTLEDNWRDRFEQFQKQTGGESMEATKEELPLSKV